MNEIKEKTRMMISIKAKLNMLCGQINELAKKII